MSFDRLLGKTFYGREWVFNKIWKSFDSEKGNIGVSLIGFPGAGKTSICCELIRPTSNSSKQYNLSKKLLAYFFINSSRSRNSSATLIDFVKEIHKQINASDHLPNFKTILPEFQEIQTSPDSVFEETILKPLALFSPDKFLFILIDGLDDIRSADKVFTETSQNLSELLLKHYKAFPPWLKLIISTRKQGKYFDGFRKIR